MLLAATMTLLMYVLGYVLFMELAQADPQQGADDEETERVIASLAFWWPYHAVRICLDIMIHGSTKD